MHQRGSAVYFTLSCTYTNVLAVSVANILLHYRSNVEQTLKKEYLEYDKSIYLWCHNFNIHVMCVKM
uniref:Putative secreted protein n=1 Tax=Rhipicephalus microplus TaxID=6941 RepID=A0A6G5A3E2_RHIMP